MASPTISEGTVAFAAPNAGKECHTWYRIVGDLTKGIPLVTMHGGPGTGHNSLLAYEDLASQYRIPVVFYDQIGCGKSTALPEKMGDETFWIVELFERELDNLIRHLHIAQFDLLGHSWGGMAASIYASKRPDGLRKLVLTHTTASMELFERGILERRTLLPQSTQDILKKYEAASDFSAQAYNDAIKEFDKRFCLLLDKAPPELLAGRDNLRRDPTVYMTMHGPNEVDCTGSLKGWTAMPHLHKINSPTLLISGEFDQVVESACSPIWEEIPKAKWVVLPNSSHQGMWEERERVMGIVSHFLNGRA